MTSKDFIIWLKGFTEGVHQYNITPVQWETLKEQLNKVDDTPYVSDNFTIGPDGAYERDPNQLFPFGTINGTRSPGFRITTTPGVDSITIANPSIASFGTSGSYNPSISTQANWYPSGSTVIYTTNGGPTWYSSNIIENDSREK